MAPFPYLSMTAIMTGLVSQQVVQMSLFAYAGFMVEYLGAVEDKDKAGFYAGLLSSGVMIGRIFSSNFWGLVADRHGSRFVIVCGLVSTAVLSIAFGLSKTFAFAFICRFLIGLTNGMMPASKTLVSEVCGTEHATVGMGLVTSSWSLGAVLGPGVGGMLAEPADHFPSIFAQEGVFGRNPYLLSNIVGAGLALVSLPLVLFFVQDKQEAGIGNPPEKSWLYSWWCFVRRGRDTGGNRSDSRNDGGGGGQGHTSPTDIDCVGSIEAFGIRKPSWMQPEMMPPTTATADDRRASTNGYGRSVMEALAIKKPSWMQAETVPPTTGDTRCESSRHAGDRVGRATKEIKQESLLAQRHIVALLVMEAVYSVYFACGLMVLLFEVVAVPYLTPWLGVQLAQRLGSVFEVPIYYLLPLMSRIGGGGLQVTLTGLVLLFTSYVCTNSFFVGTALTINTATVSARRGELNGISSTITSLMKALSPIVAGSLFAYSINSDHGFPINHHLAFIMLGSMRLIAACMGWNRITDNANME